MKKISVRGTRKDSGFAIVQAVLVIFILAALSAGFSQLLTESLYLLERKSSLLANEYHIEEVVNESL